MFENRGRAREGSKITTRPSRLTTGMSYVPRKPIRRSALVSPWGVGSMVDFPGDESLMTAGLDAWPLALQECPSDWKVIEERLQKRLGVDHFRLPPDFRPPGPGIERPLQKVPFVRFPQWHYCTRCRNLRKLTLFGGTQRCDSAGWGEGKGCDKLPEHRRPRMLPVRFVAVCQDAGHIQDFPFLEWAHRSKSPSPDCANSLRLLSRRSAAGLSAIVVKCRCGESASMAGAFGDGALDKIASCCGQRPWLGEMDGSDSPPEGCGSRLRVVQRGASNAYFPHVATSIYLPLWGDNIQRSVVEALEDPHVWNGLTSGLANNKIDYERCKSYCLFNPWRGISPEELYAAAQSRLDVINGMAGETHTNCVDRHSEEERYRLDEYEAMRSGKTIQPDLQMTRYAGQEYGEPIRGFFRTVTLVRKLRETRVLYGFSRYLPDDGRSIESQMKDMRLDSTINWLPAIVTKGEGIFFELDETALAKWLEVPGVFARASDHLQRMKNARTSRGQIERPLAPKFIMIHTLAHLIINQLAFDCGYGSSSLRERIYCDSASTDKTMQGFLIYTASGDSEGTLGGLVRQGQTGRIEKTLHRALRKAAWCSFDPVCAESGGQGPDNCNRAACHGCAVLPETCCEEANKMLDRVAVVGLADNSMIGYFDSFMKDQFI